MGATLDKFMTIEEVPEEWRSLDVTVGGPVDASNFCDNGVRTYKYNLLNFFPKSMFEQMMQHVFELTSVMRCVTEAKRELASFR